MNYRIGRIFMDRFTYVIIKIALVVTVLMGTLLFLLGVAIIFCPGLLLPILCYALGGLCILSGVYFFFHLLQ